MKISVLSVIAVLLLGALPVQSQVVFEETGIKAVFQKAREENKLVFMDCYTSWCGPCKKMLKEVFSRKDIGEYMNTRFVNYKQDMEQEEGKELAGKYGVEVYPTFFILDAAGEVRHKMVGGMTAGEFLKQVQLGSGENSLFAFNHRYRQGERNPQFMIEYIGLLSDAYMKDDMQKVLHEYWETLDDRSKSSATTWPLVKRFVREMKSPEYLYLLEHKSDFEANVGKEEVNAKIWGDLLPLIGNHCNDMIFKNRPEDPATLEEYRSIVEKSGVERMDYLLDIIGFTRAYVDNDLAKALKMYRRNFSKLIPDERFNATLQLNGMLIGKGTPAQCKQGLQAIRRTIKSCGWSEEDPLFKTMIKGLEEKS